MLKVYALFLALVCAAIASAQTTIFVTPSGTGGGTSWADARSDLATAMAQAQPNTEIWVAQGTYTPLLCSPCTPNQRAVSFELKPGVSVIGGFTGSETAASQASPSNVTTLSGEIGTAGDATDNSYTVVLCERCGTSAALTNLNISGGYANSDPNNRTEVGSAGGGLYLDGDNYGGRTGEASPTITACTISNNFTTGQGGGIFIEASGNGKATPTFASCTIEDNVCVNNGGGVFVDVTFNGTADVTFTDTRFLNNGTTAFGAFPAASGGAIYVGGGGPASVTMDRCLANGNTTDLTTAGMTSGNSGANGAFAYVAGTTVATTSFTVRNSVITGNSSYAGAGVYLLRATGVFTNMTMVGNTARGQGGSGSALYINQSTATIANSIIFGNTVTVNTSNTKDIRWEGTAADVTASYTLFSSTSRADLRDAATPGSTYTEGAGIIYGTNPDFVDINAQVPVLKASSPALDVGDNASATSAGGDYFGLSRVQGTVVDLGAVELQSTTIPVELASFGAAATGDAIAVTWVTTTEIDVDGFRVLRSLDGEDFEEVDYALATGAGTYRITDAGVVAGQRYYYQLESVDLDGSTQRSQIATATAGGTPAVMAIYPNPASDAVTVSLRGATATDVTIAATLTDLTGRTVRTWQPHTGASATLPLTGLAAGTYVLRVSGQGGAEATLLTVQP